MPTRGNDRDGDRISDDRDQCPDDAEDFDGFQDEDGCPDPDNDRDGILDNDDKCPNEPETHNGYQDEDGCPDHGCVIVRRPGDCLWQVVHFDPGDSVIAPRADYPEVVASLALPEVLVVAVRGHQEATEPSGLAQARASSVRAWLMAHGADGAKLVAVDAGADGKRAVDFELRRQQYTFESSDDTTCTAIGHVFVKLSAADKKARCHSAQ